MKRLVVEFVEVIVITLVAEHAVHLAKIDVTERVKALASSHRAVDNEMLHIL